MGFLAPLSLLFGLLAVPVVALYFLRLRRVDRRVSSTMLWREMLRELEVNVPWQRLRASVLLLLQLLAVALLAFALARPYFSRSSGVRSDLILFLDASASMSATDVGGSRFRKAQEEAVRLVEGLAPGDAATVILVEEVPKVLITESKDLAAVSAAITGAHPGMGSANLGAAMSLAASLVPENRPAQAVVLSDGKVENFALPSTLPFGVRHELVGVDGSNLAVASFGTRRTEVGLEALVRVTNHGSEERQTNLELYLDGKLHDTFEVRVPSGDDIVQTWRGLPAAELLEVRLLPGDVFALDDRAWAVGDPGRRIRALLVTPGNRYLEKGLSLQPGLELVRASPASFSPGGDYDLWVFDGFKPAELPRGAILLVDPPPGDETWLGGAVEVVDGLSPSDDVLLRYADLSNVHILDARRLDPPSGARPLLVSTDGPVMAAWEEPGHRLVVLAFDLHHSDLPLQPSFPILLQNLVGWLVPSLGAGLAARPGEIIEVPISPEADAAWVEEPGGRRVQVAPPYPPRPYTVSEVGPHRVVEQLGGGQQESYFVSNLFMPQESSLAPTPLPAVESRSGTIEAVETTPWELAPWLVLGALAILGLEWWFYSRVY